MGCLDRAEFAAAQRFFQTCRGGWSARRARVMDLALLWFAGFRLAKGRGWDDRGFPPRNEGTGGLLH